MTKTLHNTPCAQGTFVTGFASRAEMEQYVSQFGGEIRVSEQKNGAHLPHLWGYNDRLEVSNLPGIEGYDPILSEEQIGYRIDSYTPEQMAEIRQAAEGLNWATHCLLVLPGSQPFTVYQQEREPLHWSEDVYQYEVGVYVPDAD